MYKHIKIPKDSDIMYLRAINDPCDKDESRGNIPTKLIKGSVTWINSRFNDIGKDEILHLENNRHFVNFDARDFETISPTQAEAINRVLERREKKLSGGPYKYRFKTEEEFRQVDNWIEHLGVPSGWGNKKEINKFLGDFIPNSLNGFIDNSRGINLEDFSFPSHSFVKIESTPKYADTFVQGDEILSDHKTKNFYLQSRDRMVLPTKMPYLSSDKDDFTEMDNIT